MDTDAIMEAVDESPRLSTPAQEREPCWVCLDEGEGVACQQLISPCRCPRAVHPLCLARWQLRSAGKGEETHCRFCRASLPDWRDSMTPEDVRTLRQAQRAPPAIMAVAFNGKVENVKVESGPEGYARFLHDVRELFGITAELEMELTFDCAEPATGQPLVLNGGGAYHAAVHCAAVAAAQRQVPPPQSGDRYKARRARRSGFFVRAARAVTRSLRGSPAGGGNGADVAMVEGSLGSEDEASDGHRSASSMAAAAAAEAASHLPPTEAHVAVIHPAVDSPLALPPPASSPHAGLISDSGEEPAPASGQSLSPKAGLLPVLVLAPSAAAPVS